MTNHPHHDRPDGRDDTQPDSTLPRREYSFPEGTVYATIRPARFDYGHLVARLEITTHTADNRDDANTALTIAGRRYTVTALHRSRAPRMDRFGVFISWQCEGRDRHSGCAHGHGHPVEPHTQAWTRLHDIAQSTLRRLASDVPGWEHDSVRLHWLRERSGLLDTIRDLNRKLGDADTELRSIDATLHRTGSDAAPVNVHPDRPRCVVLFCGGAGEWLVHARDKTLGFELIEPMCHDHAHRTDCSYDILSAEPIPANPTTETPETEQS